MAPLFNPIFSFSSFIILYNFLDFRCTFFWQFSPLFSFVFMPSLFLCFSFSPFLFHTKHTQIIFPLLISSIYLISFMHLYYSHPQHTQFVGVKVQNIQRGTKAKAVLLILRLYFSIKNYDPFLTDYHIT